MSVEQYEQGVIVQVTVPANQPANSLLTASIILDPQLGGVNLVTIPQNEAWVIDDVYVTASQSIDAILVFKKGLKEEVARTPPINSLLVSNPSRPRIKPILYRANEMLSINAINLQAGGSSATILTVHAKVRRFVAR
jgi:hypothetical protein